MDLEGLNQWLAERNLKGHWDHQQWSQTVRTHLWKGKDIFEGLNRAGELITTGEAGRRTIQMRNPGLSAGMTNTIHISVQLVNPGEVAAAHRHTAAAIRFILKGNPKAYTVVQGERLPMSEGDLLTTPNWTWHDHFNGGDEPVVWLDGLDIRLVGTFGAMIQENFKKEQQPIEKPDHYSAKVFGQARPTWIKSEFAAPPYRYPWTETYASLLALKESAGDPFDGVLLEYANPLTGGPTLQTFSCQIQLLRPKEKTHSHRHTSTTVYHGFRGSGLTKVSANNLNWDPGDIFVVPSWQWHSHENTTDEDAILFSITDRPAVEVLGLYREEADGEIRERKAADFSCPSFSKRLKNASAYIAWRFLARAARFRARCGRRTLPCLPPPFLWSSRNRFRTPLASYYAHRFAFDYLHPRIDTGPRSVS